jgi:hypothetical protein
MLPDGEGPLSRLQASTASAEHEVGLMVCHNALHMNNKHKDINAQEHYGVSGNSSNR